MKKTYCDRCKKEIKEKKEDFGEASGDDCILFTSKVDDDGYQLRYSIKSSWCLNGGEIISLCKECFPKLIKAAVLSAVTGVKDKKGEEAYWENLAGGSSSCKDVPDRVYTPGERSLDTKLDCSIERVAPAIN